MANEEEEEDPSSEGENAANCLIAIEAPGKRGTEKTIWTFSTHCVGWQRVFRAVAMGVKWAYSNEPLVGEG